MRRRDAIVFVDWDSARRVMRPRLKPRSIKQAAAQVESVVDVLQQEIARYLEPAAREFLIRVRWRVYHGWHNGLSPTYDRQAFEKYIASSTGKAIGKVSFGTDFAFSSVLLCGSRRSPLLDTLRTLEEQHEDGTRRKVTRQKMVDTALICDLLHSSRSDRDAIQVVIGDDDDLLPGIFTAESWGAQVHMLRRRNLGSRFVDTRGVVSEMSLSAP